VARCTVERLMKKLGLCGAIKGKVKRTTIWTGWCYVALVLDVFARRIIGHCVSKCMNRQMVATAFKRAVFTRVMEGITTFAGLIHHNDKGSQYTSDNFVKLLALHGVKASIGTIGDSFDNALAESINGTLKTELVK